MLVKMNRCRISHFIVIFHTFSKSAFYHYLIIIAAIFSSYYMSITVITSSYTLFLRKNVKKVLFSIYVRYMRQKRLGYAVVTDNPQLSMA